MPASIWSLKSISAARKSDTETEIDFDTLPQRIADVHAGYHDTQLSQEFQAAFDGGGKSAAYSAFTGSMAAPAAWSRISS